MRINSLETIKDLAERVGLPRQRLRELVRSRSIEHIFIGARPMFPEGSFERYIEQNTVKPCPKEITAPVSNGLKSAIVSTSYGQKEDAVASTQRASEISKKLRSISRNSSKRIVRPEPQET